MIYNNYDHHAKPQETTSYIIHNPHSIKWCLDAVGPMHVEKDSRNCEDTCVWER